MGTEGRRVELTAGWAVLPLIIRRLKSSLKLEKLGMEVVVVVVEVVDSIGSNLQTTTRPPRQITTQTPKILPGPSLEAGRHRVVPWAWGPRSRSKTNTDVFDWGLESNLGPKTLSRSGDPVKPTSSVIVTLDLK